MPRDDYGSGSIHERSKGRWRVTVELPRDPITGKRRRRRFTVKGTRRDALKALREALRDKAYEPAAHRELPSFRAGKHIRSSHEVLDAWIRDQQTGEADE